MMEVKEAYSYLEDIVSGGFITLGLKYKDFNIVLKSLTDRELNYLAVKHNEKDISNIPVTEKIAYSTYFLNGNNCLIDRHKKLEYLEVFYGSIPAFILNTLSDKIDDLFRIFVEAHSFLEGFCYTPESKEIWIKRLNSLGRDRDVLSVDISLNNFIKDKWIILNERLDREDRDGGNLDLALFVASSYNPTGVKSVTNSIKLKREERDKEREEILEYGHNKRRIAVKKRNDKWSKPLVTNEDLVRELNRVKRGEKDKHDQFIDEWLRRRAEADKKAQEIRIEKANKFRKEFDEKSLDIEGTRRATPEELNNIVNRRSNKRRHTEMYNSAYADLGKSEDLIRRMGSRVIKSNKRD